MNSFFVLNFNNRPYSIKSTDFAAISQVTTGCLDPHNCGAATGRSNELTKNWLAFKTSEKTVMVVSPYKEKTSFIEALAIVVSKRLECSYSL